MGNYFEAMRIVTGISYTALTTTSTYTLPISQDTLSAGPRYIRILAEAAAYINLGTTSAVTVGTGGSNSTPGILVSANQHLVLHARGFSYIATIAKAATVVNVAVIES